jgi:hypothetical protein
MDVGTRCRTVSLPIDSDSLTLTGSPRCRSTWDGGTTQARGHGRLAGILRCGQCPAAQHPDGDCCFSSGCCSSCAERSTAFSSPCGRGSMNGHISRTSNVWAKTDRFHGGQIRYLTLYCHRCNWCRCPSLLQNQFPGRSPTKHTGGFRR